MAIKMDVGETELLQLIRLGLDSEESPIQIADGYEAANLKIKANGSGASFALVETENEDDDED